VSEGTNPHQIGEDYTHSYKESHHRRSESSAPPLSQYYMSHI